MNDDVLSLDLRSGASYIDTHLASTAHVAATTATPMLIVYDNTAGWVIDAARKLDALGRLRANWDSYDGLPLRKEARELAVRVLEILGTSELPVPGVILGSGGAVHFEWHARGRELDVELGGPDAVDFVKVNQHGQMEEGRAQVNRPGDLSRLTWWLMRGR